MAFTFQSHAIGTTGIFDVTTIAPGTANLPSTILEPQLGEIRQGWDPVLGSAEFIYLKGVAALTLGDLVSYNAYTGVTTRWAGTANSGVPLAVAVSLPSATQYGWFQISGNAILNVSGAIAAGNAANWTATGGAVQAAGVAGKQVLNCAAATANGATINGGYGVAGVLAASQAVYTINRPFAQGNIT